MLSMFRVKGEEDGDGIGGTFRGKPVAGAMDTARFGPLKPRGFVLY